MRLDELSPTVIREQIERLRRNWPNSKLLDVGFFADEVRRATRRTRWTNEEFIAACDAVIDSEEFFPKISTILKHRPERPKVEKRPEEATGSRCYRCKAEPFEAGYENNFLGVITRVRCNCPDGLPGWETPAARELTAQLRGGKKTNDSSRVA